MKKIIIHILVQDVDAQPVLNQIEDEILRLEDMQDPWTYDTSIEVADNFEEEQF